MKVILCFLGLASCFSIKSQERLIVEEVKEKNIIQIINSITYISDYETDNFNVKVLTLNNLSGSAPTKETHEVTDYFLIAISEYDEYPNQSLFKVGNFFKPEIFKVSQTRRSVDIEVKHLTKNGMNIDKIHIELHSVKVL